MWTSRLKINPATATFVCTGCLVGWTWGDEYLSNLENPWIDPSNPAVPSMGDNLTLIYSYAPFVVHFFTGSSVNEGRFSKIYSPVPRSPAVTNSANSATAELFELSSVTFEFQGGISQPWSNITTEIYQQVGTDSILLGELGNPSFNPTPTQWPWWSSFIDFHPLTYLVLQPSSEYFFSLDVPYNFPPRFAMIFSLSSKYITSTDWRMGITTTHVPVPYTEYLKFPVNATAIQGTNSTSGSGTNSTGVAVSNVCLSAKSDGSSLVLSWPSSTAPAQLYSSPSFESGAWTLVSAQPVVLNENFVVTLPVSGSGSFFRLQAQ